MKSVILTTEQWPQNTNDTHSSLCSVRYYDFIFRYFSSSFIPHCVLPSSISSSSALTHCCDFGFPLRFSPIHALINICGYISTFNLNTRFNSRVSQNCSSAMAIKGVDFKWLVSILVLFCLYISGVCDCICISNYVRFWFEPRCLLAGTMGFSYRCSPPACILCDVFKDLTF